MYQGQRPWFLLIVVYFTCSGQLSVLRAPNYSLFSNNLVWIKSADYPEHGRLVTAEVVIFNEYGIQ